MAAAAGAAGELVLQGGGLRRELLRQLTQRAHLLLRDALRRAYVYVRGVAVGEMVLMGCREARCQCVGRRGRLVRAHAKRVQTAAGVLTPQWGQRIVRATYLGAVCCNHV